MKPRVFIGSSTESRPLVEALQLLLEPEIECLPWYQGFYKLTASTLAELTERAHEVDFAVFVFGPDDVAVIRGDGHTVTRDNVIFETGLFLGVLGPERTCWVVPERLETFHLPTDLLGLTAATYDPQRLQNDPSEAALGRAATLIKKAIGKIAVGSGFLRRLGVRTRDIEGFYKTTGLTYAYRARAEAKERMLSDIGAARHSVAMYARVYISELLKDRSRLAEALAEAVSRSGPEAGSELVLSHTVTDPTDEALASELWRAEDPPRPNRRWKSLARYQEHLKASDALFEDLHEELGQSLAGIAVNQRLRVRFRRAYLRDCLLPYSMVVIDDCLLYVSFYSLSRNRYGSFAPTMRLVCAGGAEATWASSFLREKQDIDLKYTTPRPVLPLL